MNKVNPINEEAKSSAHNMMSSEQRNSAISEDELDFVTDSTRAILEQSPHGARALLWMIYLLLILFFVWSYFTHIDQITRGEGRVIPSQQLQVVQNLEGGIVTEILVREGESVQAEQVLLRIDDTRFSSTLGESLVKILSLRAKVTRLTAEADSTELKLPQDVIDQQAELAQKEIELFQSRQQELAASLDIYRYQAAQRSQELRELQSELQHTSRSFNLVQEELNLTKPLVGQGVVSPVGLLRLERQVTELKGKRDATRQAIPRVKSTIEEARRKVEEVELNFRNQARQELNQALAELKVLEQTTGTMKDRVKRTAVRSPVNGIVQRLLINTVGGVVQPGQDLVEIIPLKDTLLIEARIKPADIGFLHPGQKAVIKYTAYDFAIYGGMDAYLQTISADAIIDEQDGDSYYLAKLRTDQTQFVKDGKVLPIIPGMVVNIDILTGKKSILAYLLKPVLRAREYAFSER